MAASKKAQEFFEKKKSEVMSKKKDNNKDGKIDAKDTDTSKMPPQLRKHFESKRKWPVENRRGLLIINAYLSKEKEVLGSQ